MDLSPSSCSSLEQVFDRVLFLLMIVLCTGMSHGLHPTKVRPLPQLKGLFVEGESGTVTFDHLVVLVEEEQEQDPAKIKQLVLSRLGKVPDQVRALIENYELEGFVPLPLRYRHPWELLWGNISEGNVCVAGDALHPMTADMGQGACSALEDSVVLARCLAEALLQEPNGKTKEQCEEGKEENKRIELGLKKYAKERTWRSIEIISVSYIAGFIQESSGKMMTLMRDKALAGFLSGFLLKIPDFDCGKLTIS